MRSSEWSSLAISACRREARLARVLGVALVSVVTVMVASPAGAHIDATPAFLQAGGTETISLTAHNDRPLTMEAFAVTAPAGLRIEDISALEGWEGSIEGKTARWTGGRVAVDDAQTFSVVLEAPSEPGAVSLHAEQLYPDDRAVSWPVSLTVVPADESSPTYVWVVIVGGAGLLALAGIALAWRRGALRR